MRSRSTGTLRDPSTAGTRSVWRCPPRAGLLRRNARSSPSRCSTRSRFRRARSRGSSGSSCSGAGSAIRTSRFSSTSTSTTPGTAGSSPSTSAGRTSSRRREARAGRDPRSRGASCSRPSATSTTAGSSTVRSSRRTSSSSGDAGSPWVKLLDFDLRPDHEISPPRPPRPCATPRPRCCAARRPTCPPISTASGMLLREAIAGRLPFDDPESGPGIVAWHLSRTVVARTRGPRPVGHRRAAARPGPRAPVRVHARGRAGDLGRVRAPVPVAHARRRRAGPDHGPVRRPRAGDDAARRGVPPHPERRRGADVPPDRAARHRQVARSRRVPRARPDVRHPRRPRRLPARAFGPARRPPGPPAPAPRAASAPIIPSPRPTRPSSSASCRIRSTGRARAAPFRAAEHDWMRIKNGIAEFLAAAAQLRPLVLIDRRGPVASTRRASTCFAGSSSTSRACPLMLLGALEEFERDDSRSSHVAVDRERGARGSPAEPARSDRRRADPLRRPRASGQRPRADRPRSQADGRRPALRRGAGARRWSRGR